MAAKTRRWPFDLDAVTKGSTVMSAEAIDEFANAPRESKKRRLAVLRLMALLKRGLKARGVPGWTVCERAEALVVLTDAEASVYNQKRTDDAVRTVVESTARLVSVDVEQLSAEESAEHDRRVLRSSYLVAGLRSAKAEHRRALKDARRLPGP